MKRILFISRSKLSHNIVNIIIQSLEKKVEYLTFTSLNDFNQAKLNKTAHVIMIDQSTITNSDVFDFSTRKQTAKAEVIFLNGRNQEVPNWVTNHEQAAILTKPFLPDELIEALEISLGGAK